MLDSHLTILFILVRRQTNPKKEKENQREEPWLVGGASDDGNNAQFRAVVAWRSSSNPPIPSMATNLPSCRLVSNYGAGGASKAQAALGKILAVISTVHPSLITTTAAAAPLNSKPAFDLMNLSHASLVTDPVAASAAANSVGLSNCGSISPAESVAAERSSEGGKMRNDDDSEEEISEITNNTNTNIVVQRESNSQNNGNYLDLLLEAVQQHELQPEPVDHGEEMPTKDKSEGVTNDNDNSSKERVRSSLKRSRVEMMMMMKWRADQQLYEPEEETAPVVRSKRGRNQKLPSRYRDSVLEPWAKPPTVNRHRHRHSR